MNVKNVEVFSKRKIWRTESVTVETFSHEFLKRYPSPKQLEALKAVCGTIPDQFDMRYNELVLLVGQKGGKNFTVEILVCYYLYKLLNLYNPHEFFELDQSVEFNITNSSMVNERQAKGVFFERIKNVINRTIDPKTGDNWFERHVGLDLRPKGFGDMKAKNIEFPALPGHGKVKMHSFDSTASAPEGLEIFLAIMDEPSRANTQILYDNAKKLFKMYRGNIAGSFPNGLGKLCLFSYPEQEVNDLTVERHSKGEKEESTFVMKATTYEFNPNRKKEDNQKFYDDDPIDALCRFECIVPANKFGFFQPYFDKIPECINSELVNRIKFKPSITQRQIKAGKTVKIHEFTGTEILDIQGDNKIRVWAGDPGKVHDMFVLAGGYAEYAEDDPLDRKTVITRKRNDRGEEIEEEFQLSGRVIVDTIIIWKPEGNKRPVDFLDVEHVLCDKILKVFPQTRSVHFDHWNSESIKQRVQQMGIQCETHYFSNQMQLKLYTILRALIWNNMFEYLPGEQYRFDPKVPEIETELRQLLLLNKTKIDHPENGSKDISDVLAILSYFILQSEFTATMNLNQEQRHVDKPLEYYVQYYNLARKQLYDELGQEPSDKQIAEKMTVITNCTNNPIPTDWIPEIRELVLNPSLFATDLSGIMQEGYNEDNYPFQ